MSVTSLAIKITAVDLAGSVLRRMEGRLKGLQQANDATRRSFDKMVSSTKLAAKSLFITQELARGLGRGVKGAASLEEAIINLRKESLELSTGVRGVDELNEAMSRVQATAFELQKTTPFDITKIINQATVLKRAGFQIEEIVGGALETTAKLATVEGLDPNVAAEIVVFGKNIFNLSKQKDGFAKFADDIAKSTSVAAFSVEDFGQTLSFAGSSAKNLGISAKDFLAMTAALANVGQKGGVAATTLDSFFRGLKSKRGKEFLIDEKGEVRNIEDVLDSLKKRLDSFKTTEQRLDFLGDVFDIRGERGVNALTESTKRLKKEADKQAGIQAKINELMSGFNAQVDALRGTGSSAIALLFQPALGPLKEIVKLTNEFVGSLGEAAAKEESLLAKIVTGTSAGAVAAGGLVTAGALGTAVFQLQKVLKGTGGLRGLISGVGDTASGIAKGKIAQAVSGVQPVFVVNASDIANAQGQFSPVLAGVGPTSKLKKAGAKAGAELSKGVGTGMRRSFGAITNATFAMGQIVALGIGAWSVGSWIRAQLESATEESSPALFNLNRNLDDLALTIVKTLNPALRKSQDAIKNMVEKSNALAELRVQAIERGVSTFKESGERKSDKELKADILETLGVVVPRFNRVGVQTSAEDPRVIDNNVNIEFIINRAGQIIGATAKSESIDSERKSKKPKVKLFESIIDVVP